MGRHGASAMRPPINTSPHLIQRAVAWPKKLRPRPISISKVARLRDVRETPPGPRPSVARPVTTDGLRPSVAIGTQYSIHVHQSSDSHCARARPHPPKAVWSQKL